MDSKRAREITFGNPWGGDLIEVISHGPNRYKAVAWRILRERCLESPNYENIEDLRAVAAGVDEVFNREVVPRLYQYKAKRLLSRLGHWIFRGWAT